MTASLNPRRDIDIIEGLHAVAADYDYFILDIFGVLHNGIEPFPTTIACLQHLKDAGKEICLLSNTPRRTAQVRDDLARMSITPHLYDHIMTSGESTHIHLRDRPDAFHAALGDSVFFMGGPRMSAMLDNLPLTHADTPEQASFVLNAIPGTEEMSEAARHDLLDRALARDLPMLCANPDFVVYIGDDLKTCAGTYAKYYEDRGGQVVYHGKPHPAVYESAWALLGRPDRKRILAIGDALHTDIQGANRFGIDSLFNLSGIHEEEVKTGGRLDCDLLNALVGGQPHRPRAVLHGFAW